MSDQLPDRSAQRASDADREAVVERLRAAAQEGRLDLAEFEERMTAAYQAKTYGELAPLTFDLPDTTGAGGPVGQLAADAPSRVVIESVGSSTKRDGQWVVPREVVVKGNWGSVVLDLTRAKILSPEVEIALATSYGSLVVIVPDGTVVDTSELSVRWGSVHVRTEETTTNPTLRLRVTGRSTMGSVVIRRPGYFARRRLRKAGPGVGR